MSNDRDPESIRVEVPVPEQLADSLNHALAHADEYSRSPDRLKLEPYPNMTDSNIRFRLVARVAGLTIKIWSDEHPPPHFHVDVQGHSVSYSIDKCERLAGGCGLKSQEKAIKAWWASNKNDLIKVWNETRPSDCQVGPMPIDLDLEAARQAHRRRFISDDK